MDRNPKSPDRRVVITGLGAVTAAGWGIGPFREVLRSGRTAIGPFDRFNHAAQRTHVAGQVPRLPAPVGMGRSIRWRQLSTSDRFALFSALDPLLAPVLEACLDLLRTIVDTCARWCPAPLRPPPPPLPGVLLSLLVVAALIALGRRRAPRTPAPVTP